MLLELRVENLLLIERAELRLGPGLNAITGETGAGKTMLAHALDLLLGGKAKPGIVRPGAPEAWVEGVFTLPAGGLDGEALAELRERLPEGEDEIVLGRRVSAEGRTRAFVGGRSATAADLAELGGRLVSFYGQHEHRRLTLASAQLEVLDHFCGRPHLAARATYAEVHRQATTLRRELEELQGRTGARERDRDLLAFELDEIDAVEPTEEDERGLRAERERLRRMDALTAAAAAGSTALSGPEDGEVTAGPSLAEAERLFDSVGGVDPELDALSARLVALRLESEDLALELGSYLAGLEGEPGRLEQVEERLELYDRLARKHGGSVASVLAHAAHCRLELERLEDSSGALDRAAKALEGAIAEGASQAAALSATRREAAPRLAEQVLDELAALAMESARFEVSVAARPEPGPTGADGVELLIAPNPGVPLAPLGDTASGGELSRVMLALMSVAAAGGAETLVFDEVDAGIGGQTARAVGERLRGLAGGRQVLCITHLPQIASLADRHFRLAKDAAGELASATVEELAEGRVVEELVRMLGADTSDHGARRHAEELLAAA